MFKYALIYFGCVTAIEVAAILVVTCLNLKYDILGRWLSYAALFAAMLLSIKIFINNRKAPPTWKESAIFSLYLCALWFVTAPIFYVAMVYAMGLEEHVNFGAENGYLLTAANKLISNLKDWSFKAVAFYLIGAAFAKFQNINKTDESALITSSSSNSAAQVSVNGETAQRANCSDENNKTFAKRVNLQMIKYGLIGAISGVAVAALCHFIYKSILDFGVYEMLFLMITDHETAMSKIGAVIDLHYISAFSIAAITAMISAKIFVASRKTAPNTKQSAAFSLYVCLFEIVAFILYFAIVVGYPTDETSALSSRALVTAIDLCACQMVIFQIFGGYLAKRQQRKAIALGVSKAGG
jgi:hypothetical protein